MVSAAEAIREEGLSHTALGESDAAVLAKLLDGAEALSVSLGGTLGVT